MFNHHLTLAMNKIEIIMDNRESNETLKDALLRNSIVTLKTGTLKAGDFLINNLLLVERKTLKDLVVSVKDGRIFQQAAKLASSSKYTMIILEGTSRDIQSLKMKREAIQGTLICLSLKFRIPIIRSVSPEETAKLLIVAFQQIINNKPYKRNNSYRPGPFKRNNKRKHQIFMLQGLPGIGPVRAKLLLEKFGTLNAVFNASLTELKQTGGIGNYVAKKIISVLNEDMTAYYPHLKTKGES